MKTKIVILIICSLAFGVSYILLTQMPLEPTEIPFSLLVKNADRSTFDLLDDGETVYTASKPKLMVELPAHIAELEPVLPQAQTTMLAQLMTDDIIIIAAFQGALTYTPHGIDIQRISYTDPDTLTVQIFYHGYQDLVAAGPGASDFEIVAIDRADLPATEGPITVNMIDQHGDVIATTTFTP